MPNPPTFTCPACDHQVHWSETSPPMVLVHLSGTTTVNSSGESCAYLSGLEAEAAADAAAELEQQHSPVRYDSVPWASRQ